MFLRLILRPTYLIVVRSVFRLSSDSQAQVSKLPDFELHYSNIFLVERVAYPLIVLCILSLDTQRRLPP